MKILKWIVDRWHAWQRTLDVRILWPICCEVAVEYGDDEERHLLAKQSFAMHVLMDPAWLALGDVDAIIAEIEALPWRSA